MSWLQISKQSNAIIANKFGNDRISTKRCMPFVGSLKIENVIHAMSSNSYSDVDDYIITQRIHC